MASQARDPREHNREFFENIRTEIARISSIRDRMESRIEGQQMTLYVAKHLHTLITDLELENNQEILDLSAKSGQILDICELGLHNLKEELLDICLFLNANQRELEALETLVVQSDREREEGLKRKLELARKEVNFLRWLKKANDERLDMAKRNEQR